MGSTCGVLARYYTGSSEGGGQSRGQTAVSQAVKDQGITLSRCRNMLRMLMTATVLLNLSKNLRHSSESRQPLMSSSTKLKAAEI